MRSSSRGCILLVLSISAFLLHDVVIAYATASNQEPAAAAAIPSASETGKGRKLRTPFSPRLGVRKCVFILATGRSGSTGLMDTLNQLPDFLVRGEHWRAIGNLYDAYRNFQQAFEAARQRGLRLDDAAHQHVFESFDLVKRAYGAVPTDGSVGLFTEFREDRVLIATRAYYKTLFGYHGPDVVSGFKEIRYVCGEYFPAASAGCEERFHGFVGFLRNLCWDVKLIFNSRASTDLGVNKKLYNMDASGRRTQEQFMANLGTTHRLYDEYARVHPDHAFRIHMEDMYDKQKNETLARELLSFLGQDLTTRISFSRMPAWNVEK